MDFRSWFHVQVCTKEFVKVRYSIIGQILEFSVDKGLSIVRQDLLYGRITYHIRA